MMMISTRLYVLLWSAIYITTTVYKKGEGASGGQTSYQLESYVNNVNVKEKPVKLTIKTAYQLPS